jgi:hypothetical protein
MVLSRHGLVNVDAENFYVLEDWVLDKSRGGTGVTGFVNGIQAYQQQVILGLEEIVKYPSLVSVVDVVLVEVILDGELWGIFAGELSRSVKKSLRRLFSRHWKLRLNLPRGG